MSRSDADQRQQRLLPWMQRTRLKGRCLPLLISLVALLALYPYLERGHEHSTLVRLLFSIVPLAGVYAVSTRRLTMVIACVLAVPFLGYEWLPKLAGHTSADRLLHLGVLVFYAFTTLTILDHVLRGPTMSDDKIYGAISVYLLLGLTFCTAYMLIESIEPGTFVVSSTHDPDGVLNWSDLLYFSFVTLTTLGYGDITPITSKARSLAFLEAATGVMYVAVLIARLVASASRSSGDD